MLSNKTGGKIREKRVAWRKFIRSGPTRSEIVYGTSDGRLGQVEIGRFGIFFPYVTSFVFSIAATTKWEITNPTHLSGISGIDFYDILADGVPDLIVAREDGTVQVFNFESMEEPILKYTYVKIKFDWRFSFLFLNKFFFRLEWKWKYHKYRRWNDWQCQLRRISLRFVSRWIN